MGLDIYKAQLSMLTVTHWLHTVAYLVFGKGGKCSGHLHEKTSEAGSRHRASCST